MNNTLRVTNSHILPTNPYLLDKLFHPYLTTTWEDGLRELAYIYKAKNLFQVYSNLFG